MIKILIVEDEQIVATDIKNKLSRLGYEVTAVVNSGESALEEVSKNIPDLALMDIKLEGDMDGVETAGYLREKYDIPVIYLTAFVDQNTLEGAKVTQPYGYILKPFVLKELQSNIEIAIHRSRLEKKLRQREQWLSTILHSIGDAVIVTNENEEIMFMNPVAEHLTGSVEDEVKGKNLEDVYSLVVDDSIDESSQVAKSYSEPESIDSLRRHSGRLIKNGTEIPIEENIAPIKDHKGDKTGSVLVFRDISELKNIQDYLVKIQKIESLAILAGAIAHNFNNSLTAILGNLSLVHSFLTPDDKLYDMITDAEDATMIARNLTQQLSTFSKGGVSEYKEVSSIGSLLTKTANLALEGSHIEKELSIPADQPINSDAKGAPDGLWPVNIDVELITQAINNVIMNAKQAMPAAGTLSITAKNIDNLPSEKNGGETRPYVMITIKDTGIGITKDDLPKIFDPFFSTKSAETGLGLAVTRSIILNHDGLIEIDSEVNKGTTCNIYLPATVVAEHKTAESPEAIIYGKGRVLVMDDEIHVRKVVSEMLAHLGYDVVSSEEGLEATKLYEQAYKSEQPFDAVLMDLTVKIGMEGSEATKRILELDPNAKVIVSSGYADSPIISNYLDYGFVDRIVKPYRIQALSKVMHSVIESEKNLDNLTT